MADTFGVDLSWVKEEHIGQDVAEAALRMVPLGQLMENPSPLVASPILRRPIVRHLFCTIGLLLIFAQPNGYYYSRIPPPPPASAFRFRVLAGSARFLE